MSGAPEREPGWTQPFPSESRGPNGACAETAGTATASNLLSACPFITRALHWAIAGLRGPTGLRLTGPNMGRPRACLPSLPMALWPVPVACCTRGQSPRWRSGCAGSLDDGPPSSQVRAPLLMHPAPGPQVGPGGLGIQRAKRFLNHLQRGKWGPGCVGPRHWLCLRQLLEPLVLLCLRRLLVFHRRHPLPPGPTRPPLRPPLCPAGPQLPAQPLPPSPQPLGPEAPPRVPTGARDP